MSEMETGGRRGHPTRQALFPCTGITHLPPPGQQTSPVISVTLGPRCCARSLPHTRHIMTAQQLSSLLTLGCCRQMSRRPSPAPGRCSQCQLFSIEVC